MAKGQVKRKKTDATIKKLEDALKWGDTRESACAYAWISKPTFYDRMKNDKNFLTWVEDCEEYWIHIVENQKRKLVEKGYWPTVEKELKSRRPKVYGDKVTQEVNMNVNLKEMSVEELLALVTWWQA